MARFLPVYRTELRWIRNAERAIRRSEGCSLIEAAIGVLTLGTLLLNLISFLTLVLWIVLMMKAFHGVRFKVPLAGDIAESLAGRAGRA